MSTMACMVASDLLIFQSRSIFFLKGGIQLRLSESSPSAASTPWPNHGMIQDTGFRSRMAAEILSAINPSFVLLLYSCSALPNTSGKPPSSTKNRLPFSEPSRKSIAELMVGPRVGEISLSGYTAGVRKSPLELQFFPSSSLSLGKVPYSSRHFNNRALVPIVPAATITFLALILPARITSVCGSITSKSTQ